jgi:hypothetical protein
MDDPPVKFGDFERHYHGEEVYGLYLSEEFYMCYDCRSNFPTYSQWWKHWDTHYPIRASSPAVSGRLKRKHPARISTQKVGCGSTRRTNPNRATGKRKSAKSKTRAESTAVVDVASVAGEHEYDSDDSSEILEAIDAEIGQVQDSLLIGDGDLTNHDHRDEQNQMTVSCQEVSLEQLTSSVLYLTTLWSLYSDR